jgi:hypothetical protein
MGKLTNYPMLLFLLSLLLLWISAHAGAKFRKNRLRMEAEEREDFNVIVAATLTLLGLIIGFSFSMATARYDQRKNYEEEEANAIGTEYLRADLLPPTDRTNVRALLLDYLDKRILFYITGDDAQRHQVNLETAKLQGDLWSAVQVPASAQPTPLVALAVAGMNDVLNSQGYTQAAWRNRIPLAAWGLMAVMAICCNILIGYVIPRTEKRTIAFLVLPLVVSISFFMIAEIDSPRGGIIRVLPQNLSTLSDSLRNP